MSAIRAVVPVKAFALAKQRLAGVLPAALRQALARAMLEDVLDALARTDGLAGILVVTADDDAARIAARFGAGVTEVAARDGHSEAVAAAAGRLAQAGEGMLTIAADVPLAAPADFAAMLDACPRGGGFVIVPARDGHGSNAVLCVPAVAVPLRFGADSYAPHAAAAAAHGMAPVTLRLARLALDIDGPDDLAEFLSVEQDTRARDVLRRHGIGHRP
ncbi:MAG TPA: 2-phospho-L-lactate guanylyltransferase [Stellaceae bacterium]|nr:2-phospho-L-lactate guanylyltransferase [Stellaceae bacterium]